MQRLVIQTVEKRPGKDGKPDYFVLTLVIADKLSDEAALAVARWALRQLGIEQKPEGKCAVPEQAQPEKPEAAKSAPKPEGPLPEFKTGAELFTYACKHGYRLDKLRSLLGVNTPNDIRDIPAAARVLFPEGE